MYVIAVAMLRYSFTYGMSNIIFKIQGPPPPHMENCGRVPLEEYCVLDSTLPIS